MNVECCEWMNGLTRTQNKFILMNYDIHISIYIFLLTKQSDLWYLLYIAEIAK